jgi:phosphoglycolate phosphatase
MNFRAILFDLDGTLIDQFTAIHLAFSKALSKMGYREPSYDEVRRAVGGASEATMTKLIGPSRAKEAVSILRPIFEEEMLYDLTCLPYVERGLERITENKISCAVLTNKYGPHARSACKHLGLTKYFQFILGANDTNWKKPEPQLTQLALQKIGSSSNETIYVGDSPYDYETARKSNIRCHLVATGTHSYDELSKLEAQSTHSCFKSLIDHLMQLNHH